MMGNGTIVKEFDGARSMTITTHEELVYIEVGESCYCFDKQLLLHAAKKEFGIAFVVEEEQLEVLAV